MVYFKSHNHHSLVKGKYENNAHITNCKYFIKSEIGNGLQKYIIVEAEQECCKY